MPPAFGAWQAEADWVQDSYKRILQEMTDVSATIINVSVYRTPELMKQELAVVFTFDKKRSGFNPITGARLSEQTNHVLRRPYKPDGTAPIEELAALINLAAP